MATPLVVDHRVTVPAKDIAWTTARAGGPGGQNVNKVSSKVHLAFDLEACEVLGESVKARLRVLARNMLDGSGRVLLVSQKTRDQAQNLADAREKLRLLILQALVVPKKRRPTKPTRGSTVRRLTAKKQQGEKKAGRRGGHDDGGH